MEPAAVIFEGEPSIPERLRHISNRGFLYHTPRRAFQNRIWDAGDPLRELPSGERVRDAIRRMWQWGGVTRQNAIIAFNHMLRCGHSHADCQDEVFGRQFRREWYPAAKPRRAADKRRIVPTRAWEEHKDAILAAKDDEEWLLAALYVVLPEGVGTAAQLAMLQRMRVNPVLTDEFLMFRIRKNHRPPEAPPLKPPKGLVQLMKEERAKNQDLRAIGYQPRD